MPTSPDAPLEPPRNSPQPDARVETSLSSLVDSSKKIDDLPQKMTKYNNLNSLRELLDMIKIEQSIDRLRL